MEENFDEGIKAIEEGMQKLDQDVEILNQSSETLQNEINGLNNRRSIDQARFNSQIAQAKEDYVRRNGVDMPKSEEDIEVNHFNDLMKAEYQEKIDLKVSAIEENSKKIAELQAKKAKANEDLEKMKSIDANLAESYMKYKVKNEEVNKLSEEANKLMAAKMAYFREAARNGYPTYDFPGEAELEKAEENVKKAQAELAELKKPIISYGLDKQWAINTIANNLGMDSIDLSNSKAKYEDQNWYKNYVEEKKKADAEKAKVEAEKDDIESVLDNAAASGATANTTRGQSRSRGAAAARANGTTNAEKPEEKGKDFRIEISDGAITISTPKYGSYTYDLWDIGTKFDELYDDAHHMSQETVNKYKSMGDEAGKKTAEPFEELADRMRKLDLLSDKHYKMLQSENARDTYNWDFLNSTYLSEKTKGFDPLIAGALQAYELQMIKNICKEENSEKAKTLLDDMKDIRDAYDEAVMTQKPNKDVDIVYDVRKKGALDPYEYRDLKDSAKDARKFATVKANIFTRMNWRIRDFFGGIKNKLALPEGKYVTPTKDDSDLDEVDIENPEEGKTEADKFREGLDPKNFDQSTANHAKPEGEQEKKPEDKTQDDGKSL